MLRLRLGAVGVRSTADSDARMHWIGYWVVGSGYWVLRELDCQADRIPWLLACDFVKIFNASANQIEWNCSLLWLDEIDG